MEKLDITIALSHSADFEERTWTFEPIEKSFKVRAGTYAIIHKPDLDKHIQDIAIAFAKEVRDLAETNHYISDFDQLYKDLISNYYK